MSQFPASIAQHYHERTKYDPSMQDKGKPLDWNQQPDAFKEYKIGHGIDLKPYLQDLTETASTQPDWVWWQRLSQLLFYSYGLTGMISVAGGSYYVRSAPSAGALYPAEIYLISRGTPRLPAGLYNYQVQTHSLIHFWENDVWTKLQTACLWHPILENTQLALIVTAVFYRSAWRYQDRAYRRVFLDSGHLLGNVELAAALSDYRPHLIGSFMDEAINQLLYLDAEQEGAIAVVPLADLLEVKQNLPLARTLLPASTQTDYPHIPDGKLLTYFHQATQIPLNTSVKANWKPAATEGQRADKYNFPFCLKVSTITPPISWGDQQEGLHATILKRRSTRAYTGEALTLDELRALLDFTYQPQHYIDQELDGSPDFFDLSLVETFIAVSSVTGLEEGCYYYAPKAQELRQIRFKNFRQELHFLCLWQDLGRDAGAVLFHTADLKAAVAEYGDRVYRSLHMDAGHLGQRLNLAAIHLGLGVSGIGGFFDDQVNEVLGIPTDEAVLYITTLGRPQ
ncbi:SagB/ThcOx family dehydrogenase [Kovacikia minuta CCNUW1]|uniref:SagB/ThcOx family dehydrogenase n=1 Tax=Kovacikia minuta TaxID=2931930 RepID=UPI001CCD9B91|nr:SagB/ThcOx family dehydrogenase [Kovacikia minuta]UBF28019.1 SagB/ThcOx family dehydrogenase [Kovacikia minuta CCNUW1]